MSTDTTAQQQPHIRNSRQCAAKHLAIINETVTDMLNSQLMYSSRAIDKIRVEKNLRVLRNFQVMLDAHIKGGMLDGKLSRRCHIASKYGKRFVSQDLDVVHDCMLELGKMLNNNKVNIFALGQRATVLNPVHHANKLQRRKNASSSQPSTTPSVGA